MAGLDRALRKTNRRGSAPHAYVAPSARSLLTESDFTYLGYYLKPFPGFNYFGLGLTHRRVSGQLRLLWETYIDSNSPRFNVREAPVPASLGDTMTYSQTFNDIWDGHWNSNDIHGGLYYDEDNGVLWDSMAADYPQGELPTTATAVVSVRQLSDSGGTISNWKGWFGFQGIGQRGVIGGVRRVPLWFRTANGVGSLVAGFGGYASLAAQGLGASFGPLFIFPTRDFSSDTGLSWISTDYTVATADLKIGADCRGGVTSTDWFPNYDTRVFDRGIRKSLTVVNWFDGNDTRNNPSTEPTYPTDLQADPQWWYGPTGGAAPNDPDNFCRWCWGDSYHNTFCWVDNDAGTRSKHGIVLIPSLQNQTTYYKSSAFFSESRVVELHVFNPAHVSECIAGTRDPWDVRPTTAFVLDLPALDENLPAPTGNGGFWFGAVSGATFDLTGNRLYVGYQADNNNSYVLVFSVAGG